MEVELRTCTSVIRACGRAGDVKAALHAFTLLTHRDEVRECCGTEREREHTQRKRKAHTEGRGARGGGGSSRQVKGCLCAIGARCCACCNRLMEAFCLRPFLSLCLVVSCLVGSWCALCCWVLMCLVLLCLVVSCFVVSLSCWRCALCLLLTLCLCVSSLCLCALLCLWCAV